MTTHVLVIGNARGGTTAVCGVLRTLGVRFPESNDNHENTRLLRHFMIRGGDDLIKQYDMEYPDMWGMKVIMPRDAKVFKERIKLLSDPFIINVWRDPITATMKGKSMVDNHHYKMWMQILNEQVDRLKWLEETNLPCLNISYEKLCTDTVEQVDRIRDFLWLPDYNFKAAVDYVRPGSYWTWESKEDPPVRNIQASITVGD